MDQKIRNYWNYIKENTSATDNESGGYYLDFDNGKCLDEQDIKDMLEEYSNISNKCDELEENNIELENKELGLLRIKWCKENGYNPDKILDLHNEIITEYDFIIQKVKEIDEEK